MSDPFAIYGAEVAVPNRPAPLQGVMKTRAEARKVYAEIVSELGACEDQDQLDIYLMTVGEQLIQFQGELDFLWQGDGEDFAGLEHEIENAKQRVSEQSGSMAHWAN